jgi:hypothetical protein
MFGFIKKLFGDKPAETPVPYKVEAPRVEQFPFPSQSAEKPARVTKPKAEKKPAVKAKTTRKPRTPKV